MRPSLSFLLIAGLLFSLTSLGCARHAASSESASVPSVDSSPAAQKSPDMKTYQQNRHGVRQKSGAATQ